ncbi:MAG: FAD-dependent oxidoreductase, partial [Alphaproteobacteria bacterium]|nr:FAD-dependent oxidoreductase [Alphaproteobacteria bacterium]
MKSQNITIIGAGFIGLASALNLQKDGHKVTLIDRVGPGNGASSGNAGVIVQGNAEPIADPKTLFKVPGWLLDQTGPLTIRWPHLPALIPFLGRMILESHPSRYRQNAKALNQLTNLAVPEWNKLIKNTKSEDLIRPVGWLKVFESEASFNTYGKSVIESCKQFGVRCEALNIDELRQLEPHLSSAFKHGILQPDSSFVTNPQKLLNQLTERFIDAG